MVSSSVREFQELPAVIVSHFFSESEPRRTTLQPRAAVDYTELRSRTLDQANIRHHGGNSSPRGGQSCYIEPGDASESKASGRFGSRPLGRRLPQANSDGHSRTNGYGRPTSTPGSLLHSYGRAGVGG